MFTSRHGHLKGHLQDTLNLGTSVDIGIIGFVVVLIFLAEIHTARQFTDNHEVGSTQQFIFQRRLVQQTVEGSHRTDIGKESEFLAHGQQTGLWTHLGRRVVVILKVTNGSEEHSVGTHTNLVGGVRIRVAHLVDGVGTTNGTFVFKLVSALLGNSVKHSHTLFHDLRTDTIALENSNLQFHSSFLFSFS